MRVKSKNRSRTAIIGRFQVTIIAVIILATAVLQAQQASGPNDGALQKARGSRPVRKPKPTYVAGEVIVKLREGQSSGIGILSQAGAGGNEKSLLRLQAVYGLHSADPIFKGLHRRLTEKSSAQTPFGLMSSTKQRASASITDPSLQHFYLLKTDRNVPGICAELRKDPDVEHAQHG